MDSTSSADPWRFWCSIVTLDESEIESLGKVVPIPRLSAEQYLGLCEAAKDILQQRDIVAEIPTDTYVIGDLHGNLHDLLRILRKTGLPPTCHLLFLGDYVDRGQFSIETLAFLFSLLITYPEYVVMLRGNHEFFNINMQYGFKEELDDTYHEDAGRIHSAVNAVFEWLPLAAVVQDKVVCVHGGISPRLRTIDQIRALQRPIEKYTGIVSDIVWSDPSTKTCLVNGRGQGCTFTQAVTARFLSENHMEHLVRSHQCVAEGYCVVHQEQACTVFSSSGYSIMEYGKPNKAAFLYLCDGQITPTVFDPLSSWLPRKEAFFKAPRKCSNCADVRSFRLFDKPMPSVNLMRSTLGKEFLPALKGINPSGSVCFTRRTVATTRRDTRSLTDMNPVLNAQRAQRRFTLHLVHAH